MTEINLLIRQSIVEIFQLFFPTGIENSPGNQIARDSMNEEIRLNAFSCESADSAKFSLFMTRGISYFLDFFAMIAMRQCEYASG